MSKRPRIRKGTVVVQFEVPPELVVSFGGSPFGHCSYHNYSERTVEVTVKVIGKKK